MTRLLLSLASALSISVLSCGGGSDKASEGKQGSIAPTAAEVVAQANTAANRLKSFHFKLSHENGGTPMPLGLELSSAEGDIAIPNKLAADVKAKAAGLTVSLKAIGVDEKTWITNPFTRRWQLLPGSSIREIADPARLIQAVLGSLHDVSLDGSADIDGARAKKVNGKVDASALKDALATAQPGYIAVVELFVGESDSLPRRVRLSGPLSRDEPRNIVRQLDISRFDAPVDIKPPE